MSKSRVNSGDRQNCYSTSNRGDRILTKVPTGGQILSSLNEDTKIHLLE
ncbi:hypothetical protein [Chamaesiphon minutus]|nr:hypothetical protein [Chamaesiphon minutus]